MECIIKPACLNINRVGSLQFIHFILVWWEWLIGEFIFRGVCLQIIQMDEMYEKKPENDGYEIGNLRLRCLLEKKNKHDEN